MVLSRKPFAFRRPVVLSANSRTFRPAIFNIGGAAFSRLTRGIARFARMRRASVRRAQLDAHRARGYVILPGGTAVKVDRIDSTEAP